MEIEGLELLVGELVSFRPFKYEDAEIYSSWLQNVELRSLVGEPYRTPKEVIEHQKKISENPYFIEYIIIENSTQKPVGYANINLMNRNSAGIRPSWELMIAPTQSRHNGYGIDTSKLIFKLAKEFLGLSELYGEVYTTNTSALNFDLKTGMLMADRVLDCNGDDCYLLVKRFK